MKYDDEALEKCPEKLWILEVFEARLDRALNNLVRGVGDDV